MFSGGKLRKPFEKERSTVGGSNGAKGPSWKNAGLTQSQCHAAIQEGTVALGESDFTSLLKCVRLIVRKKHVLCVIVFFMNPCFVGCCVVFGCLWCLCYWFWDLKLSKVGD